MHLCYLISLSTVHIPQLKLCLGVSLRCSYRASIKAFSHDVTAAILVFQNNETAAMLLYQDNPVGKNFLLVPIN